jgi:Mrp family chromosome partitioning ATPase
MQIDAILADVAVVKQRLKDTESRIEQLNVESPVRGRISVISLGDRPLKPFTDKRAAFAAVGGLGLGAMGCGAVLLFGLIDRRVRHICDLRDNVGQFGRLLGVLPILPNDLSDPLQAKVASHSVHHIRSQLQALDTRPGCRSIAITSPSPGAGKTSLTLALGLSYAASGSRTLLVDCDMVGGGLTRRVSRSGQRKLGQVLGRAGLLDAMKIEFILKRARATNKRFGEAAVSLRYLTQADVEHALEVQSQTSLGLRELLSGDAFQDCIIGTGTPNLFILPLGSAQGHHVAELSTKAIRGILSAAAEQFDTVLVDTGPVLGSIEAGMVATAVDQVVVALSRGEGRPFLERAMAHLQSIHAKVAGVVFNRANPDDIVSSGYSSSVSRPSGHPRLPDVNTSVLTSHGRLGPVATAVLALGPTTEVAG